MGKNKIVWITDLHLSDFPQKIFDELIKSILEKKPDLTLLTGDISDGPDCITRLKHFSEMLPCPLAYVFGRGEKAGAFV